MRLRQIRREVREIAASLILDYPAHDEAMEAAFPVERDRLIADKECERLYRILARPRKPSREEVNATVAAINATLRSGK